MLICPLCQTVYPPGAPSRCERDGAALLEQDERCGTVIGNYRILGRLGYGGMGVVYRAAHVYIDKPVAVKILHERFARHEEAVQRFLREARAATLIAHPNIVDVTDFGVLPEGGVYFVMEYLEGLSLDVIVQRDAPLPLLRAINIVNQIALALGAAHAKGIIHRDLKPENVIVIPRPGRREIVFPSNDEKRFAVQPEGAFDFVKVLDFGVAKVHEIDEPGGSGTMAGTIFGTPQYIAPEQARATGVDHRADIYALGIVFYELLTGQVPFDGESAVEVLARQIQEQPLPPTQAAPPGAEITPAAERLILCALEKDPDRRPRSMAAFCDELQSCYGDVRYHRHAHLMPGAVHAGFEPHGPWQRAPVEASPESRLRPRRLTDELRELFDPPPPGEPPKRKRLTEELAELFGARSSPPAADEVVVEPVTAVPASEISTRVPVAPGPPATPDPAPAPTPPAPTARPPGVRALVSDTALGRAVRSRTAVPRAETDDAAIPEPIAADGDDSARAPADLSSRHRGSPDGVGGLRRTRHHGAGDPSRRK